MNMLIFCQTINFYCMSKITSNQHRWYIYTTDERTLTLLEALQSGGEEEKPVELACKDVVTRKLWPVAQEDFTQFDDLGLVYEIYCSDGSSSPNLLAS